MRHRWERLTFLHWSFEPAVVQRLVPDGLDGRIRATARPGWGWYRSSCACACGGAGALGLELLRDERAHLRARHADRPASGSSRSTRSARGGRRGPDHYRLPYFWSSMRLAGWDQEIVYSRPPPARAAAATSSYGSGSAPRTSLRTGRPGPFPDRPVACCSRGRAALLPVRAGRARALAAAPRRGAGRRHRLIAAAGLPSPPAAAGPLLAGRRRPHRPPRGRQRP